MQAWLNAGGAWQVQDNGGEARGSHGAYHYVEVDNVSGFGEFGLRGKPRPVSSDIRIAGSNIELSWTHTDSFVTAYQVWRATDAPYAQPGDPEAQLLSTEPAPANVGDRVTYTDATSQLGNASANDYYFILAEDSAGNVSAATSRVGEFDYTLVPGQ
jgi:hypothetical protein